MSQTHWMSRLRHTHRYSSGIINNMLQAGQPWVCALTFAGTIEILTRQNTHCSGTHTAIYILLIGAVWEHTSEERE